MVQCKKSKLQPVPTILEGITYADVQPIFVANCHCHMTGGKDIREANLSTYENAKREDDLGEAIRKNMYTYFNGDATKYQKVYSWVKRGRAE